ncbi:Protein disulfide isomerase [Mycena venus]|uniref:Protein disulfide isomerase n=1 Tax=Mycena venus TaxID=2733690 RepID=A0A8H6YIX3_9AGAR|nr:Protein disulfide isomerase [Mycena venus]
MFVAFYRLPISLLLTLFLIAFSRSSAASPTTTAALKPPLTKDDFTSTVAKGVWLVEFFSPYCGHCRAFAPTWQKLVAHSEMSAGVQLAQVDCSVSGDLCNANSVKGYPQMNLFRDGAFVEVYRGSRDFNLLTTYLAKHAPTQDPWLSVTPMHRPDSISQGDIKSPLTQHNFNDTIANGFWFVQYYTPWCGHCKRFAPTWKKLVAHSDGVHLARVDCDASRDLCTANKVFGYPQLDLYRDGEFVGTYRNSRTFDLIVKYLAAATRTPPSAPILNLNGEVAILSPDNFTAVVFQGPAFVSFYPKYCYGCEQLASIWTKLATVMQQRVTIAEVRCGEDNSFLCIAHGISLGAAHEPTLIYFPSVHTVEVTYTGPRTLAQLGAFVDVGGVYPPPAMEFSRDTYRIVKAAPITVLATVGMEGTIESVAARVREIAAEWYRAHGPSNARTVQFAWEDPTKYEDVVRAPVYGEVTVTIVDHEAGSRGYGKVYLTEKSGEQLKLATESIFSVLEDVARAAPSSALSWQGEVEDSAESVSEQAMRYLYAADAYVVAHPLKTLYWLCMSLAVVYLAFRRCLRAESELQYDADKGMLVQ